jgi:drug/metabolite transporter (DMT)-like permease
MNTQTTQSPPPGRVVFFLVLTTVFWGGSFVFNKIGFREIPPVHFYFLRFTLATGLMALLCIPRLGAMNRDTLRRGVVVGLALAATNLVFVLGLSGTSASRAGFLNNLFVLFIPLISFAFWRERLSPLMFGWISLAVVGLWQLAAGSVDGFNRGDVLSTLCALFISIHIIVVSRVLKDEDVWLVSLVQFATVAVTGLVLVAILPWPAMTIGSAGIGALVYCAVFPTILCFTLQNAYQRYVTPTRAGLIYTLDPVWSLLGGMLILGERLSPRELLGCILILCAVAGPLLVKLYRESRGRVI